MLPTIREKSVFGLLLHKIEKETPDLFRNPVQSYNNFLGLIRKSVLILS